MKNSNPLLVGVLALLTVTATGVAWQQYWKAARLAAASVGAEANADLQKRLAAAERRNAILAAELEARQTAADPTATDAAAGANTGPRTFGPGGPGGRGGRGGAFDAMMNQPEMQQLRALQQKAALDPRFAPLFKALNVSPAKVAQLKTLMVEREATRQDVMNAAREQGVDPRANPDAFRKLVANAQTEIDNQIKSVLGEEGYAQYQQYTQTQPQRATVEQLRASLSYTSDPLSDTQASQLVQILAANAPTPSNGGAMPMPPPDGGGRGPGGPGGGPDGGGAPITTAAIAQAQTVLSATQADALQQMAALQQAQQQAMQAMRAAENQGQQGASGTPATGGRGTGRG